MYVCLGEFKWLRGVCANERVFALSTGICMRACVFDVLEHGFEELHRMNLNEMKSILKCSLFLKLQTQSLSVYDVCEKIGWMSIFLLISTTTTHSHRIRIPE